MLVLVGLHRIVQLSFFSITGWSIGLDYSDIEWFALEMNRDHSVISETASKYCISDSFVDYDGYSISSKGFLPQYSSLKNPRNSMKRQKDRTLKMNSPGR